MKVFEVPMIFTGINFNLDFINNETLINYLTDYYYTFDCVYDNIFLMRKKLQLKADLLSTYYNKLYKTTLYDYNPIENYNRLEEHIIKSSEKGESSQNANNINSQYPMNTISSKDVLKNQNSNSIENSVNKEDSIKIHTSGNIGVTTSQQMIEQERQIILNIVEKYINEYQQLFMLTI